MDTVHTSIVSVSHTQTNGSLEGDGFNFSQASDHFAEQARSICQTLESELGDSFISHPWQNALGEGIVRSVSGGTVLERGSVNFSNIAGDNFPASGVSDGAEMAGSPYRACGVSVILHPSNPFVPTTHLNVRLLGLTQADGQSQWWFGGGFDLTPYFPFEQDCRSWHASAASLCGGYGDEVYAQFKQQCDDYFYLPHRRERRGVGGIFFDRLNEWGWQSCFAFASQLVPTWQRAWLEIADRRRRQSYGDRERSFQLFRRGRYVEFNLLYDRGTLFGLHSGGRVENILASLPPLCRWGFGLDESDGEFADLARDLSVYLEPRQWLDSKTDQVDLSRGTK